MRYRPTPTCPTCNKPIAEAMYGKLSNPIRYGEDTFKGWKAIPCSCMVDNRSRVAEFDLFGTIEQMKLTKEDIHHELEKLMQDSPKFVTKYPNGMGMIRTGNLVLYGNIQSLLGELEQCVVKLKGGL